MYEGIARLIGDGSITGVTYSEVGASTVFLNRMPSAPDNAVLVLPQQGSEPDSKLPYDPVQFQVVVRGEPDGVWALATGKAGADKRAAAVHAFNELCKELRA